jgi:predicted HicB family RNase H-like nuclease
MIEYKGYIGRVTFDDEANIFHGQVFNTRDVITFQGSSVHELRQSLADSIEVYLAFVIYAKKRQYMQLPYITLSRHH